MLVKDVGWHAFRLPFRGDFSTARGTLAPREGVILQLEADNGLIGLGEASPLPEFGGGTLTEVLAILQTVGPSLIGLDLREAESRALTTGHPALINAFDTALCDLMSQAEGLPLWAWLSGNTAPSKLVEVLVNATVGESSLEGAMAAARRAVEQGFSCLKLKVGAAATLVQEVERVATVRDVIGPTRQLRLDANGAWTVDEAIKNLRALQVFDLELVEQPVAGTDIAGLATVRRAVAVRIGADEAVTSYEAASRIIAADAADVLVIKPMVVGGLRSGQRIIQQAERAGLQCIVTTTLDSGVGIAAAAHLAALLRPPRLPCGLSTATLLAGTLVKNSPPIQSGLLRLSNAPGLGIELNLAQLAAFRVE